MDDLDIDSEIKDLISDCESDLRRFEQEICLSKERASFNFWLDSYLCTKVKYEALVNLKSVLKIKGGN